MGCTGFSLFLIVICFKMTFYKYNKFIIIIIITTTKSFTKHYINFSRNLFVGVSVFFSCKSMILSHA